MVALCHLYSVSPSVLHHDRGQAEEAVTAAVVWWIGGQEQREDCALVIGGQEQREDCALVIGG